MIATLIGLKLIKRGYRRLSTIGVRRHRFSSHLDDLCPPCKLGDHVGAEEESVCTPPKPRARRLVVEDIAHDHTATFRREEMVVVESLERATHK